MMSLSRNSPYCIQVSHQEIEEGKILMKEQTKSISILSHFSILFCVVCFISGCATTQSSVTKGSLVSVKTTVPVPQTAVDRVIKEAEKGVYSVSTSLGIENKKKNKNKTLSSYTITNIKNIQVYS